MYILRSKVDTIKIVTLYLFLCKIKREILSYSLVNVHRTALQTNRIRLFFLFFFFPFHGSTNLISIFSSNFFLLFWNSLPHFPFYSMKFFFKISYVHHHHQQSNALSFAILQTAAKFIRCSSQVNHSIYRKWHFSCPCGHINE